MAGRVRPGPVGPPAPRLPGRRPPHPTASHPRRPARRPCRGSGRPALGRHRPGAPDPGARLGPQRLGHARLATRASGQLSGGARRGARRRRHSRQLRPPRPRPVCRVPHPPRRPRAAGGQVGRGERSHPTAAGRRRSRLTAEPWPHAVGRRGVAGHPTCRARPPADRPDRRQLRSLRVALRLALWRRLALRPARPADHRAVPSPERHSVGDVAEPSGPPDHGRPHRLGLGRRPGSGPDALAAGAGHCRPRLAARRLRGGSRGRDLGRRVGAFGRGPARCGRRRPGRPGRRPHRRARTPPPPEPVVLDLAPGRWAGFRL